jgi:hypothetical protein
MSAPTTAHQQTFTASAGAKLQKAAVVLAAGLQDPGIHKPHLPLSHHKGL